MPYKFWNARRILSARLTAAPPLCRFWRYSASKNLSAFFRSMVGIVFSLTAADDRYDGACASFAALLLALAERDNCPPGRVDTLRLSATLSNIAGDSSKGLADITGAIRLHRQICSPLSLPDAKLQLELLTIRQRICEDREGGEAVFLETTADLAVT